MWLQDGRDEKVGSVHPHCSLSMPASAEMNLHIIQSLFCVGHSFAIHRSQSPSICRSVMCRVWVTPQCTGHSGTPDTFCGPWTICPDSSHRYFCCSHALLAQGLLESSHPLAVRLRCFLLSWFPNPIQRFHHSASTISLPPMTIQGRGSNRI